MNIKDIKILEGGIPLLGEKNGLTARLAWATCIYLGKEYGGDEILNAYLDYLSESKVNALCIPGNIFYTDTKKHSKSKNAREASTDDFIDAKFIEQNLPAIIKKVGKNDWDGLTKVLGDEDVDNLVEKVQRVNDSKHKYANAYQRREAIIKLVKSSFKSNEEYEIPIFMSMGPSEYDAFLSEANDRLRGDTTADQARASALSRCLKDVRKELSKQLNEKDLAKTKKTKINEQIRVIDTGIEELKVYSKDLIMTNVLASVRQDYMDNAEQELIKDLEEAVPNSKVLPLEARLRVNNSLVNFTYNVDKSSSSPAATAVDRMINYWRKKINIAGNTGLEIPRLAVDGGLHGVFAVPIIVDTSMYKSSELPLETQQIGRSDRYLHLMQLPPLMDKDKLLEFLSEYVTIPADQAQRMAYKFNLFSGAVITDIMGEDGRFIGYKVLTEEFLKNFRKGVTKKPDYLYFKAVGDDHVGSQHVKLIELTTEQRKRAEKSLDYNLLNNIVPYYRADNAVQKLLPVDSEFRLGDNIQGKNYPTAQVEAFEHLNPIKLGKKLSKIESSDMTIDEKNVAKERLALINEYKQNVLEMEDQESMFIDEMIGMNMKNLKAMMARAKAKELIGPELVFYGCTHTKHTYNKDSNPLGSNPNRRFAIEARRILSENGDVEELEDKIIDGVVGAGTGYAAHQWGAKDHYIFEVRGKHKLVSTYKNILAEIEKVKISEQVFADIMLGAHTHHPVAAMLGKTLTAINGSDQGDNEYAKMKGLSPSATTSWTMGVPIDGFDTGEIKIIPQSLECVLGALENPELVKKLIDENILK